MGGMRLFLVAVALCVLPCALAAKGGAKPFVDPMKHAIVPITSLSFDNIINKYRASGVAALLHYSSEDEEQRKYITSFYNLAAEKLKGMARLGAIDCSKERKFCQDNDNKDVETPAVFVYPPHPIPSYKYKGAQDVKELTNAMLGLIPSSNVKSITSANIKGFLAESIAIPKVLLFTSKDRSPTIYNALANALHDRLSFGFVKESETDIMKRFKINSVPKCVVIKGENHKSEVYKGEMQYAPMFEWLNARSETFVKGGGFSDAQAPAEKPRPWLTEQVPELTGESFADLCKKGNAICVIYCTDKPITKEEVKMMMDVETATRDVKGVSEVSKPNLNFVWMNLGEENEFKQLFDFENLPGVVVLNTHNRPRFMTNPKEKTATAEVIKATITKILEGDARYKYIKNKKLPSFAGKREYRPRDEL